MPGTSEIFRALIPDVKLKPPLTGNKEQVCFWQHTGVLITYNINRTKRRFYSFFTGLICSRCFKRFRKKQLVVLLFGRLTCSGCFDSF